MNNEKRQARFKQLEGKTIKSIDAAAENHIEVYFTDGTSELICAQEENGADIIYVWKPTNN